MRLSASPGADDRAAFEAWRCASLGNEIAYARAETAWKRLDRLSALRDPEQSPQEAVAPIMPAPVRHLPRHWPQWAGLAASLLLIVSIVSIAAFFLGVAPAPAYATGVGERRVVMLADGTRVELNTSTSITVHYASGHRTIDLERGEAVFRIARDARPFEVTAGQVHLRSTGAEVDVRRLDQGARVTVARGQVSVQDFAENARSILHTLSAGSAATIAASVFNMATLSDEDIRRDLAWRQGGLALNGETLTEAVQAFNRYNRRQIHVADPQAGSIHVGGYFETSDMDGFLKAMTSTFPVRVSADSSGDVTVATDKAAPR